MSTRRATRACATSRHAERQAMIATWREVAEHGCGASVRRPSTSPGSAITTGGIRAGSSGWSSELDADARRGARLSDHAAHVAGRRASSRRGRACSTPPRATTLDSRWRHFCREGVGLRRHGLRPDPHATRCAGPACSGAVLRPDRLLMAELTLQGRIRQVPEVLWFRRQSNGASVERQRVHADAGRATEPRWFFWPPWHAALAGAVAASTPGLGRRPPWRSRAARGPACCSRYQVDLRLAPLPQDRDVARVGPRRSNRVALAKKRTKHAYHHARLPHAGGRCGPSAASCAAADVARSTKC